MFLAGSCTDAAMLLLVAVTCARGDISAVAPVLFHFCAVLYQCEHPSLFVRACCAYAYEVGEYPVCPFQSVRCSTNGGLPRMIALRYSF